MRLWTIQPAEVWEQVQSDGHALARKPRAPHAPDEVYIPERYLWLVAQLRTRLAGYGGGLPWWAYCARPDLRGYRYTRPAGQPQVRLELQVPDAEVVSFPVWAWNEVYCGGGYLAHTAKEYRAWYRAYERAVPDHEDVWPLPEPWRTELESSWTRLFGPLPVTKPRKDGFFDRTGSREAVFEVLKRDYVRQVTPFVGACEMLVRAGFMTTGPSATPTPRGPAG